MEEKSKITVQEGNAITELSLKSFETHLDFLKSVGAVSLTFFGIIVSIGRMYMGVLPSVENYFASFCLRLLYSLSFASLVLGILGVYVCLYSFVLARRDLANQYVSEIRSRAFGDTSHASDTSARTKGVSMFYTYAGKVGLISLMLSVICFAAYAIVMIWI